MTIGSRSIQDGCNSKLRSNDTKGNTRSYKERDVRYLIWNSLANLKKKSIKK